MRKKRPFLADPVYLRRKGFSAADFTDPYYMLYYLPLDSSAPKPRFTDAAKKPHVNEPGFMLYYTYQCPFPAKYVPIGPV